MAKSLLLLWGSISESTGLLKTKSLRAYAAPCPHTLAPANAVCYSASTFLLWVAWFGVCAGAPWSSLLPLSLVPWEGTKPELTRTSESLVMVSWCQRQVPPPAVGSCPRPESLVYWRPSCC